MTNTERCRRWRAANPEAARAANKRAVQKYRASEKGQMSRRQGDIRSVVSGRTARRQAAYIERKKYELANLRQADNVRVSVPETRTLAILSDTQMPFEDPAALDQALEVVARIKADTVVLNGDIVDCYAESVFLKDWKLAAVATPEGHRRARRLMECLEHIPNKIWLGGNHEERWKKELWREIAKGEKAGAIASNLVAAMNAKGAKDGIDLNDPVGSFARIYDMAAHGFVYYPWHHRLYFAENNLVVTHGEFVRKDSGATARATFEWLGRSVIVGHTHRLGSYLVSKDGREHGGWEGGCLCGLEPEYCTTPNWQQGLTIVKINGPEFHVVPVPIIRRAGAPVAVYSGLEAE
jgi:predicted phosphodiesterase